MASELASLFQKIGLADSVAKEAAGNKKLGPLLETVIRTVCRQIKSNEIGWSHGWNGKGAWDAALQVGNRCSQRWLESLGLRNHGNHEWKIEECRSSGCRSQVFGKEARRR